MYAVRFFRFTVYIQRRAFVLVFTGLRSKMKPTERLLHTCAMLVHSNICVSKTGSYRQLATKTSMQDVRTTVESLSRMCAKSNKERGGISAQNSSRLQKNWRDCTDELCFSL